MHTGSLIPKTIFGWINKTEASSYEVTTYNMDSFFAPESSAVTNNFRKEKENWCNTVIMLMAAKHLTLSKTSHTHLLWEIVRYWQSSWCCLFFWLCRAWLGGVEGGGQSPCWEGGRDQACSLCLVSFLKRNWQQCLTDSITVTVSTWRSLRESGGVMLCYSSIKHFFIITSIFFLFSGNHLSLHYIQGSKKNPCCKY